jgi:hypothetical protein
MYCVFNCHNVARHTKFYVGQLWFNMTSTGKARCIEKSVTKGFQMLLRGKCYENVYT